MEDIIFFNQSKYIKEILKKFGLEDSKPTMTPISMEIKLTKYDEADSVDRSKYRGMIGCLLYLTASRPDIMFSVYLCARFQENPKTTHLESVKRIFRYIRGTSHLGLWYPKGTGIETIVYADSDHAGDYVDRKSTSGVFKLTSSQLSRILQTPYALETFYTSKWSLNSLDDHPNSNFFGPKHDLVKKTITTPRTTQTQLLRDFNKLYIDDIHPKLKGWEIFFRENFFCSIDISRNSSMKKGKRIISSLVISSSSSSSNDNEAPSFLKFYDELSDSGDLTKAQREKRGMFKCLNRDVVIITKYLKKQK
ncbi:hypothetical protein Tco_1081128 [Tanacetum coccineum]|uniref:Mitochondrial protein n=1 Tax=Tanacetum coccineum TaxID=301880 RepID=A0ABQ5HWT3_9ASTR